MDYHFQLPAISFTPPSPSPAPFCVAAISFLMAIFVDFVCPQELLFDEDTVLRVSTLRPRTKMDAMRSTHLKSNPWEIERAKRLGIPIDSKCYTPGPNASIGSNTRRIGSA